MATMADFNNAVIEEFRANAGEVGGQFASTPMLLLNTVGAKSGEPRTNPLAYIADGDRLVVVASFAGAPTNPPWYHNLVANPEVGVEIGNEAYRATASILGEPERSRLYDQMAAAMPTFAEYQSKTTRVIPVIVLTRIR